MIFKLQSLCSNSITPIKEQLTRSIFEPYPALSAVTAIMNNYYRKCSSCKLWLPASFFDDPTSRIVYKTCRLCRYKKNVRYQSINEDSQYEEDHKHCSLLKKCVLKEKRRTATQQFRVSKANSNSKSIQEPCNNELHIETNRNTTVPYAKWISSLLTLDEPIYVAYVLVDPRKVSKYYRSVFSVKFSKSD